MNDGTLICIAGYGRSGSTMLEMLLARRLSALGLGEVKYAWSRGFMRGDRCSCGEAPSHCPFWGPAMDQIAHDKSLTAPAIEDLRQEVERNRHHLAHRILGLPSSGYDRARAAYRPVLDTVYQQAFQQHPGGFVIDSSKDPAHCDLAISAWPGRTVIIHLVRDPRAVVYSRRYSRRATNKRMREGIVRSCAEWSVINLAAERLAKQAELVRLRYEDLCGDPAHLEKLLRVIAGDRYTADESQALPRGHALSGNALRWETQSIERLVLDTRWQDNLPVWERRAVSLLCAPVMSRYGYR